jgi:hypothetical protein
VRNYIKTMRVHNWSDCIQDRCKWKEVIEEAKIFNEWSCSAWWRRIIYNLFCQKYLYLIKVIITNKCTTCILSSLYKPPTCFKPAGSSSRRTVSLH